MNGKDIGKLLRWMTVAFAAVLFAFSSFFLLDFREQDFETTIALLATWSISVILAFHGLKSMLVPVKNRAEDEIGALKESLGSVQEAQLEHRYVIQAIFQRSPLPASYLEKLVENARSTILSFDQLSDLAKLVDGDLASENAIQNEWQHLVRLAESELDVETVLPAAANRKGRLGGLRQFKQAAEKQDLELGIRQDILSGNGAAAADKEVRLALEFSDLSDPFEALKNRSLEYFEKGRDEGLASLQKISIALKLEALAHAPNELARAEILNEIGNSLNRLGDNVTSSEPFRLALRVFEEAHQIRTLDLHPFSWAATQSNIGNSFWFIGDREEDCGALQQAVARYRSAAAVRLTIGDSQGWGISLNNAAAALFYLGERKSNRRQFLEAICCCRAAFTVRTRGHAKVFWAQTHLNLANSLRGLGVCDQDLPTLKQSEKACRIALTVLTEEAGANNWGIAINSLGDCHFEIGKLSADPCEIRSAIGCYQEALRVRSPESSAMQYGKSQLGLGKASAFLLTLPNVPRNEPYENLALESLASAVVAFKDCKAKSYLNDATISLDHFRNHLRATA